MTREVSLAMKKGRVMSNISRFDASEMLGIDERTLSRYESENPRTTVKNENPDVIADAVRVYDDVILGFIYISKHPVFNALMERITSYDCDCRYSRMCDGQLSFGDVA